MRVSGGRPGVPPSPNQGLPAERAYLVGILIRGEVGALEKRLLLESPDPPPTLFAPSGPEAPWAWHVPASVCSAPQGGMSGALSCPARADAVPDAVLHRDAPEPLR
jgi:hypothetical protein